MKECKTSTRKEEVGIINTGTKETEQEQRDS